MTEIINGAPQRPVNPTHIAPEKIKTFAMVHKLTPQESFATLLSKDLLERIDESTADDGLKAVVRVLVTSVIGDGKVTKL